MRTSTRLLVGLAAAGAVAAGGSAFTADITFGSDEMTADTEVLAYGSTSVTGATVKNIAYNVSSTNSSQLVNVTFTVNERVDDQGNKKYTAVMTLGGASGTQYSCTRTWVNASSHTSIVCATSATISSTSSVQLAISPV